MSKEGDFSRLVASKALKLKNPRLKIIPFSEEGLSEDQWAKLYFVVTEMMKKVGSQMGVKFLIDVDDMPEIEPECKMSIDGYHETAAVQIDMMKGIANVCIHCGVISKRTSKTEKELEKHFKKLQDPY